MKKFLLVALLGLSFLPAFAVETSAKVTNTLDGYTINWGKPDVANGHSKNDSGKVRARTCWGSHCGSKRDGSKNTNVYTSYSEYYGHDVGGANQQGWSI